MKACLAVARCPGVTVWGVTDKYSWIPSTFPGYDAGLLHDGNYAQKPAYASVLTALGGSFTSSSSSPSGTAKRIFGSQSGRCADVVGGSQNVGTRVQLYDCSGGTNQQWTLTSSKQLTAYAGTRCLDAAGTSSGSIVQIYTCSGASNQQWNVNSNGTITSGQSGLCLDATGGGTANGTPLQLYACSGGANQKFSLS